MSGSVSSENFAAWAKPFWDDPVPDLHGLGLSPKEAVAKSKEAYAWLYALGELPQHLMYSMIDRLWEKRTSNTAEGFL